MNSMLLITLATIFLNITICFCATVNGKSETVATNTCETPICLEAAQSIMKTMNTSHKPCNNFYLFACGTFVKGAEVPRGQGFTNTYKIIENEVKETLKNDLERNIFDNDLRTFKLLKSYYNVCLNSNTREAIKEQKNLSLSIFKMLGGWPLLDGKSWDETKFDWKNFIYGVRRLGILDDMNLFIRLDGSGSKIKIKAPIISEIRPNDEEKLDAALYFGARKSRAKVVLNKLQEFQYEFVENPKTESRKPSNQHTIKSLVQKDKRFPWDEYLNTLFPQNIQLDQNKIVCVNLKNFHLLLDFIENTPKRLVANYLFWELATVLYNFIHIEKQEIKQNHYVAPGTGHKLWKYCIDYLTDNIPVATKALYVDKYLNKSWKSEVQELTQRLFQSIRFLVSKATHMKDETKKMISDKLQTMKVYVAYTDEYLSDEKIEDYFKNLNDSSGNFLKNHLNLMTFKYEDKIERQIKNPNMTHWASLGEDETHGARYYYQINSLYISPNLLHNRLFNPHKPNYLNYGALGKVIAHEIGHSLDTRGTSYDRNGKWWKNRSEVWSDEEALEKIENDEKCLIEQYDRYNASKRVIAINGNKTLDENIADYIGIKSSYAAYEDWINEHGEEPGLPGLPYTPRQLFWLSMAHTECHRMRRKGWDDALSELDLHTPGPFRIIVPFSNMPEFARDFNCPAGSRMNPVEKCQFL